MFIDYVDRGLAINSSGVCLTNAAGTVTLRYDQVAELSHRMAGALISCGVGPGSKVAVYSPNDVTALVAVIGIFRAGATWVALNPRSKPAELAALLDAADCDFVLYHGHFAAAASELASRSPKIQQTVGFGGDATDEFERWLAAPGTTVPTLDSDPDALAMIISSGGTTGTPKAVPITNRQYLTMCLAFNAHMAEPTPPVYVLSTPMTHAAGVAAWPVLGTGGTVVVHDGAKAEEIFESIERHSATRLFLPPTAIYTLLAHHAVRDANFASLRHFIYAAAPISVDKLVEAVDVFGPVMAQTFGQAEAPMILTYLSPADHVEALADESKRDRLASCGRPSLVARVEIMDDDGRILPPGVRGEIVARGDLTMRAYYGNPEATAAAIRPGGWLCTGDIGVRDEDGFVYILDRKRDMIISGGFNVFPSEVERVLWSHPAVLDCAVIGIPDEKWGESVTAVVELKAGRGATEGEMIALCKAALGSAQAPKRVLFRELPRSSSGKVMKRDLRDEFWVGQERLV